MNQLNYWDDYYWYLFLSPFVGFSFVLLLALEIVAVKWLLRYVQTHTFVAFGWYRILAGAAVFALLALGH